MTTVGTGEVHDGPLLSVERVSKTFQHPGDGEAVAVADVSFEIRSGQTVGLVGPSGAGKTTLARIIAGVVAPDDGAVVFDGYDLSRLSGRARRRAQAGMHLVFQDPYASLAPGVAVAELVAEPVRIHRRVTADRRRALALAALEEVQLHPPERYADRYAHELSGGERQRVALARALILRPGLIVADEPTQMLDAALRADLVALLETLRERHGMAQLFVTHDLALAERVCERILVMDAGRIVEQGTTTQVLAAPQHARTVALVAAVERLRALVGTVMGS